MTEHDVDAILGRKEPHYGYRSIDGLWWPDGEEAHRLHMMFMMRAHGASSSRIAREVRRSGPVDHWTAELVDEALGRTIYKGLVIMAAPVEFHLFGMDGSTDSGLVPLRKRTRIERLRIVSDDLWDRANRRPEGCLTEPPTPAA